MNTHDLYIFIDALGWEQVVRSQFLESVLPYQNPCETQFGYSSTCDPTIITGKTPAEHGHFSFFVRAQQNRPFEQLKHFSFLPHRIAANHRIRNRVSRIVKQQLQYTGYFQLYSVPFSKLPDLDYTEKKDIYLPGGIIGKNHTAFDQWRDKGLRWYVSNWRNNDDENLDQHFKLLQSGLTDKSYLILTKLDAVMHKHGPNHEVTERYLCQLEKQLVDLIQCGERTYDEFNVHVFSDHGMHQVTQDSDLMVRWERLPLTYGKDYYAVWDSTMARFWFNSSEAKNIGLSWLLEQPEGMLLTDAQLQQWGCFFDDGKYGDYFYLLNPGVLMTPSFMNLKHIEGMHGYHPKSNESKACWLSNHPERKANKLTDIYQYLVA